MEWVTAEMLQLAVPTSHGGGERGHYFRVLEITSCLGSMLSAVKNGLREERRTVASSSLNPDSSHPPAHPTLPQSVLSALQPCSAQLAYSFW